MNIYADFEHLSACQPNNISHSAENEPGLVQILTLGLKNVSVSTAMGYA